MNEAQLKPPGPGGSPGEGQALRGGIPAPVLALQVPGTPAAAKLASQRLAREWTTVAAMIHCYCRGRHGTPGLCAECRELLAYAAVRLERCRFGPEKPTCARCPVHCYQANRREQIKAVMRYAGPRMLWQHPLLSLRHWLDGLTDRQRPTGRLA